jgi:hypothetical protein
LNARSVAGSTAHSTPSGVLVTFIDGFANLAGVEPDAAFRAAHAGIAA